MSFRLRDYRSSDFDDLWSLDQICFPKEIAYARGELHMYLALRTAFCVIADGGGAVVGFVLIDSRPPRPAYVVTIDVHPDHRRAGVASTLLEEVERRLLIQESSGMRLEVAENNRQAIDFYQKRGFREIGRKPGYYNGSLDAISMLKEL